jgi:hypothetical protein
MNSPRKEEEETAMLTKKPLGGWSCASCEKDLVNISGRIPGYQAWSKLPFRNPGDRIAKVGQGFSKMLALVNPSQTFVQSGYNTQYQTSTSKTRVPPLKDLDRIQKDGLSSNPRHAHSTSRDFNSKYGTKKAVFSGGKQRISSKFKKTYQSANNSMDEGDEQAQLPQISATAKK